MSRLTTNRHIYKCHLFFILLSAYYLNNKNLIADSRTDYLIELLKTSGNYRVKVQSAKTLGQIGVSSNDEERKKIVGALISACSDNNELVRMTAAASLGIIGDSSAIATLEKLKSDKVKEVQLQAKDSIEKIKSITKSINTVEESQTISPKPFGPEGKSEEQNVLDRFYIAIGTLSDRSGLENYDAKGYVKNLLINLIDAIPGVKIKPEEETKKETEKILKKQKLVPYTLTGSIGKVNITGKNSASAEISIIVLDGDGNVTMMLKGKGAATLEGSRKSSKENEAELITSALTTAVKGAVEPFSNQLQNSLNQVQENKGKSKKNSKKKKKKGQ